jgi:oxaloacetate decarboxylase (Na+ extruding) subunit gamma
MGHREWPQGDASMSELMFSGLELMVLGMGIVFLFLSILIFTLRGMSRLAVWLGDTPPQAASQSITVTDDGAANPQLVAVISAAITRYRASHRR